MKKTMFMLTILVCTLNLKSQTKVIANWDMVPRQVINTATKVGVVAFHESGVNVTFTINGGSPVTVNAPTYNDQSKVWEYWTTIDPAQYSDGQITISATAYPDSKTDSAKQLADLILYANSKGSLTNSNVIWADITNGNDTTGNGSSATPYRSIGKAFKSVGEGGTVILKKGTYVLPPEFYPAINYNYWTTVTRDKNGTAPNLGDVKINGTRNPQIMSTMYRFDGISFFKDSPDQTNNTNPRYYAMLDLNEAGKYTWFNNCEFYDIYGKDNNEGYVFAGNSNNPNYYLTDCYIHDIQCVRTWWERGTTYKNIGDIIWWAKTNAFYANVTIDNLGPSPDNPTHPHSDLILYYNPGNPIDNLIMYNVDVKMSALCMGFMGGDSTPVTNNAIVNLLMQIPELRPDVGSQILNFDHLLMWHNTIANFPVLFRLENGYAGWNRNADIRDNIFFQLSGTINNSIIDRNHFSKKSWDQSEPLGTNATVGKPYFVDSTSWPLGYRLQEISPAYRKGVALECVPADINGYPYEGITPSIGSYSSLNTQVIQTKTSADGINCNAFPNPFNNEIKFNMNVPANANITIDIYDIYGRKIKNIHEVVMAAGNYQLTWNGTNADNGYVSPGVYICRFSLQNQGSISIVILKK